MAPMKWNKMTALSTSLAIPLYLRGLQILIYLAVRECMLKQYHPQKGKG